MGSEISPDGHGEDHSLGHGVTHLLETTLGGEDWVVTKDGLLLGAELLGDGAVGVNSGPVGLGVEDNHSVLDVDTTDLNEIARSSHGVGDELSDDSHLLGGVNSL
jgi:hypothetical protein